MICLSLWLWWTLLRGSCQTEETWPVILGQGQPCGVGIEGVCGANLTCVTEEEQASATGVCTTPLDTDCVPCTSVQCPPNRRVCPGGYVTEPCGCCPHCARQQGQLCGGPHWSRGYCDRDLTCSQITGLLPATPPQTGVCKVLPGHQTDFLADPLCPLVAGCNVRFGTCDCYSVQTCHLAFSYQSLEDCLKAMKVDEYYWIMDGEESEDREEMEEEEEEEEEEDCTEWNCEVREGRCVCGERSCDPQIQPLSEEACQDLLLVQANCSNVTCPELPVPSCSEDSILTQPFILPGSCCPLVPALCTCVFENCKTPLPTCPPGQQFKNTVKANGFPGSCCDSYLCESSEEEEDPQDS
ncbi:hypothetical protein AALO_G00126470 [Alosa alosa]|uniref:IGFBP N-terminal domain-containing protein n=1 Tax=Alosa alosa TaxID=278164 RepID=A0AAV6GT18_9TELE|nr:cysteine-rich motor neuron 1 protein-like isoform X1 [Alosa alosa]KAG5275966.1 hypothetical protein AALO_G00126470 [Alosa alosa]